jgi:hypothetical protein
MGTGGGDDSLMKFWAWDKKNLPSITHGIRTAVAATASVVIARFVQMPEAYWAAIATLVVMQSTLGATLTLSVRELNESIPECISDHSNHCGPASAGTFLDNQFASASRRKG